MKETLDVVRHVIFESWVLNIQIGLVLWIDSKSTVTVFLNQKSEHVIGQEILYCSWRNGHSEEKKSTPKQ